MKKLIRLIASRIAFGAATLFIISLILFVGVEMLPGDAAHSILGQDATPDNVAALREELGLNLPPTERYLNWLGGVLKGDLGKSVVTKREISTLIGPRIWNTLFLGGFAAAISVPLALGFGILAATYRDSIFDRTINFTASISISLPEFFLCYLLILIFSAHLGLFPGISNVHADLTFSERLYRTALPALALTLGVFAYMMRMTRAAIVNLLAQPYIQMARLKGAAPSSVIVRHALPNAFAPIINVVALSLAYLVVGVVVVEVIFVYPGVGQLLVDSVSRRDVPVVQACSMFFALIYVSLNLMADVLTILTNPRLLHPR
ncbi:ABC transporter permease (plasmid) [Mesorhizobium sp. 131-2-5]|uniref:ABC transporter permease n=1 Tax=Mesorhizobium sp. 131-2-5 TaxID=2744519 RepID=UPI0018EA8DBB|nr:ABC transporter permease [Mesorhizobium sp. 131-2-5]BCH05178.1 ABC transporter permease [Mesorhizobium sp. 131-2-5]